MEQLIYKIYRLQENTRRGKVTQCKIWKMNRIAHHLKGKEVSDMLNYGKSKPYNVTAASESTSEMEMEPAR